MLSARIQLPQDYDLQQLLTETFAQFPIHRLKYYIWRWYRAAMEYEPYHYCQCPARVIDLHRLLETLILVAEQLENDLPPAVKEAHPAMQLDDYNLDVLFNKGLSKIFETYEGVIRYLFEAEAANPPLFFTRFFRFKSTEDWLQLLDDWKEFALYPTGMDEAWNIEEMPEALELLLALCESFYLVWKQQTTQSEPGTIPKPAVKPAQDLPGTGEACYSQQENTEPHPPDIGLLDELFDHIDIELLQFELWQWFLSIFRHQAFFFFNDPSILLSLKWMMTEFVSFAWQWFRDNGEFVPETDPSATDRERVLNYETLLDVYKGRVTCLTLEETKHPGLFFRRFFSTRNEESWKDLLNNWMEKGLGKGSITISSDAEEMPEAFELLKGLAEACWLVWERLRNEEFGDEVEAEEQEEEENGGEEKSSTAAPQAPDDDLQAIIGMIRQSMEADLIFLLGKFPLLPAELGHEYNLLVLVSNHKGKPMDELESYIRNRSDELAPVYATVMQTKNAAGLIKNGNWLMHQWCAGEKKVYDAGSVKLPYRDNLQPPNPAQMEHTHRNHYTKAAAFLAGARSFLAQDEYALSAFMLHQSMESALKALLAPAMQHCFKTHSLHKLLGMVRYVSPETGKPFPRDTEEEIILFQLLQKAYIHARYKNNFTIDRAQCEALITRVASVLDMLPEEFEQMVKAIHGAENPPGFDC